MSNPYNLFSVTQYEDLVGNDQFTITFPYLRRQHVFVFLSEPDPLDPDGEPLVSELIRGQHWDFDSDSVIKIDDGLTFTSDQTLTIRRFTLKGQRLAAYNDGSRLTQKELNDVTLQLLYLIQEIDDFQRIQEGDVQGIPGDDDAPALDDIVNEVLEQLQDSELFETLTELIPLVDINAETIMESILSNHEEWSLGQLRDDVLDKHRVDLDSHDAQIDVINNTVINDDSALAQFIISLGAQLNSNQAHIVTLSEVFVDRDEALAQDISVLESEVGSNSSEIIDIKQTHATEDHVEARLQQELGATWLQSGMDARLQESQYIGGVKTTADDSEARVEAVESFLVGSSPGGIFDNPDPESFIGSVSALQTQVDGVADDASTSMSLVQEMASMFGGTEEDVPTIVAAMRDQYETYADEESAAATQVTDLQANTLPIWFSETPPDYDTLPWSDGMYATNGFPDGATWFQIDGESNAEQYKSFVFRRGTTSTANIDGMTSQDIGEDLFFIGNNSAGVGAGAWVNIAAVAIGSAINQMADVSVGPGTVSARLRDLVQVVWEDRVGAVETIQESYFDEADGILTSQYAVRINQTNENFPVMAGFGLGVQTDVETDDSVSNFMVMADNFAIVKPPPFGDDLTGDMPDLTEDNHLVPFLVDAANGNIHINARVFIEDVLYAYEGRLRDNLAGRLTFGQLNLESENDFRTEDWLSMVEPDGFRFELASSTNQMWTGTDNVNYIMWAGTGAKNANNAVFFVDEDGNAFFGGQVQAQNIAGSLADAGSVKVTTGSPPGVPAPVTDYNQTSQWADVGPDQEFTVDSLRLKKAVIPISVRMNHGYSGEARLLMWWEGTDGSGNFNAPQVMDQGACSMDRADAQTQITLHGVCPENVTGRVRFKVQISGSFGDLIHSNGYSGMAYALPTSGTSAIQPVGHETSDPDDGGDTPDPGTPPPGGGGGTILP